MIRFALSVLLLLAWAGPVRADEAADRFQKSVDQEAQGLYSEALATLDGLPAPAKDAYLTVLRRGWLLYSLGRYPEAIPAYEAAARKEPGSVEARLALMLPQMAARRWVDAERTAREVLALDADNYLASSRLAYIQYNLARYREAAETYAKVLAKYPGDVEMRSGYGWALLKQGQKGEARAEFQKILAVAPRHENAGIGLGLCD